MDLKAIETPRRKHKTLSIQEKVQLLKMFEEGTPVKRLCKIFNIGSSTIYDIKKKKEDLLKFYCERQTQKGAVVRKTMKEGKCSELERALVLWFETRRSEGETVTGGMLVEQAKRLHEELKLNFECKYSHGWLDKFKNRHGIKFYMGEGEKLDSEEYPLVKECTTFGIADELASPAQLDAAEAFLKRFSETVANEAWHSEQVYSASQTTICWRDLPQEVFNSEVGESKNRQDSDERVGVFGCFNAAGTHKCKLLVVGKDPKPKSFEGIKVLPVIYQANDQASITRHIMIDWLENHFAKEAKAHCVSMGFAEDCKILLVLDSILSPSNEECLVIDNVHILFFPFHLSVPVQPQDMGISRWLKSWYRLELLFCYLEAVIREKSTQVFLREFSTKDCIWSLARAWENMSDIMLRHSWQKLWPDLAFEDESAKDVDEACNFYKQQIIGYVVEHVKYFNRGLAKYICYENIEEWVDGDDKMPCKDTEVQPIELPMEMGDCSDKKATINDGDAMDCKPEASSSQTVEDCIHMTSRLISGLERQDFITEQEIMYLHRLKGNLIVEKLKQRKADARAESRSAEAKKRSFEDGSGGEDDIYIDGKNLKRGFNA